MLTFMDVDFPYIHELEKLIELCASGVTRPLPRSRRSVRTSLPMPFVLRYDVGFWPSAEIARDARDAVLAIEDFVMRRLPPELAGRVERH